MKNLDGKKLNLKETVNTFSTHDYCSGVLHGGSIRLCLWVYLLNFIHWSANQNGSSTRLPANMTSSRDFGVVSILNVNMHMTSDDVFLSGGETHAKILASIVVK